MFSRHQPCHCAPKAFVVADATQELPPLFVLVLVVTKIIMRRIILVDSGYRAQYLLAVMIAYGFDQLEDFVGH